MTWLCMSEDKFSELMLSCLHVGLGIQTQVFSFGSKHFYPQTSLTDPILPTLRLDEREKFTCGRAGREDGNEWVSLPGERNEDFQLEHIPRSLLNTSNVPSVVTCDWR